MLLANNHFTPVIGIDIHFTTLPPFNPFHPYIGLVLDPMDFVPFIGGTVNVNGIPRGVSDTSGIIIPLVHIPLFTPPWVMTPIIGHESTNFFASQNVYADGSRFSPKGYMVMTCNDIGIPLSLQPGAKKFWKVVPTLFAPTSYSLPIPTGAPVIVGGPYVPDWGGMLKNLLMGFGFGAVMRFGKKAFNKMLKGAIGPNWLSRALCHAGFEPVNFVNGAVVYDGIDFSLPGPIPFEWKRSWYSDSEYEGLLGYGCHWQYDRELQYYPKDQAWGLRMADGRVVAFPAMIPGESFYLRQEKVTLKCFDNSFEACHHGENLNYIFSRQGTNYYKLTKIEREGGGCAINFDYRGRVLRSVTDSAGRVVKIAADAKGRITSATVSVGPVEEKKISYTYDTNGNMAAITDALEQSTAIAYDHHRMVKKTDRNGQSFYWEYDHLGRCVHTWGDGGWQEGWLQYFPEKGYNKIIEAGGAATIYHYDENQLVQRIENPMGASKLFQYTEFMELYREVDEDGNMTGYTYNDRGLMTGIVFPDGTARQYMYDDKDRLIISISPGGSQEVYTYYEDSKRVRAVVHPDRTATTYTYNQAGLPETIKKGDNLLELTYDRFYNLTELTGNGQTTRWGYSLLGEVVRVEDTAGSVERYRYDELGRVSAITQADGTQQQLYYNAYEEVTEIDRNGETVATFAYTPLGSLLIRKQGTAQVRFAYDRMERLTKVINEHSESYTFSRNKAGHIVAETGFDAITKQYLRSPAGRVLGIKGPGGMDTKYRYNGKGQITTAEYADGSWESYSYDKDGLLIAAQNEYSHITLKRDGNGRIVAETQSRGIADEGHTVTSTYNEDGLRLHVGSTLGADIAQQYNSQGQLSHIQAKTGDQFWEAHIERNARGQATAYAFTGGVQSSFAYDSAGRPIAQTVKTGFGRESYKRSYHWNAANQLVQTVNHLDRKGINYTYDELAQLVSATGSIEPEYKCPDAVGNLYETPERKDRTYSSGGRLEKDKNWHYYYDTLGNLKLKSPYPLHGKEPAKKWQPGCWHYQWTANGMLRSVQKPGGAVVSFEYDALGRRTAKIAGNKLTCYLWDANVLLQE